MSILSRLCIWEKPISLSIVGGSYRQLRDASHIASLGYPRSDIRTNRSESNESQSYFHILVDSRDHLNIDIYVVRSEVKDIDVENGEIRRCP